MPVMIAVTVPVAMTDVANVDVDVTMPVTVTVTVTMTAMFAVALGELQYVRRVPHLWERGSDRKRLAGHHSGCAGRKADQRSESKLSEHGTLPPLTDELGPFSLYAYGMTIAILVHGESIRVFAVRRRKTNHRGRTYLDQRLPELRIFAVALMNACLATTPPRKRPPALAAKPNWSFGNSRLGDLTHLQHE
jgi:hypothetical protein